MNIIYKTIFYIIILFCLTSATFSQRLYEDGFWFRRDNKKRHRVPFEHVNNLIIIPVSINDSRPLKFIFDTGVRTTLVTELSAKDELIIRDAQKKRVYGLGEGEPLEAYHSESNSMKTRRINGKDITINVLMENIFHLSEKLGVDVNGLIGYDLIKNFIVEINYSSKILTFHNPEYFRMKSKKTDTLPITLYKNKPYTKGAVTLKNNETIPVNLLIDTGASDALWLFATSNDRITIPQKSIKVYLGKGLNGDVNGYKGRISELQFGAYSFSNLVTSFPDSISINYTIFQDGRNGTLGAETLRRFRVFLDYQNNAIYLRPNSKYDEPFTYNMSGFEVSNPIPGLPVFVVTDIIKNSPADEAGMEIGDQVISINNTRISKFDLNEIYEILHGKKGKKLHIRINRNGEKKYMKLKLESRI
jgi:hypothetical protein